MSRPGKLIHVHILYIFLFLKGHSLRVCINGISGICCPPPPVRTGVRTYIGISGAGLICAHVWLHIHRRSIVALFRFVFL